METEKLDPIKYGKIVCDYVDKIISGLDCGRFIDYDSYSHREKDEIDKIISSLVVQLVVDVSYQLLTTKVE